MNSLWPYAISLTFEIGLHFYQEKLRLYITKSDCVCHVKSNLAAMSTKSMRPSLVIEGYVCP